MPLESTWPKFAQLRKNYRLFEVIHFISTLALVSYRRNKSILRQLEYAEEVISFLH